MGLILDSKFNKIQEQLSEMNSQFFQ